MVRWRWSVKLRADHFFDAVPHILIDPSIGPLRGSLYPCPSRVRLCRHPCKPLGRLGSTNALILLANCPELSELTNLSWMTLTQECGLNGFANSIRPFRPCLPAARRRRQRLARGAWRRPQRPLGCPPQRRVARRSVVLRGFAAAWTCDSGARRVAAQGFPGARASGRPVGESWGMDNGLTKSEASETLTHLLFYAGWPHVFSAIPVAKDVCEKRPK
jgi:hypothetical protein